MTTLHDVMVWGVDMIQNWDISVCPRIMEMRFRVYIICVSPRYRPASHALGFVETQCHDLEDNIHCVIGSAW